MVFHQEILVLKDIFNRNGYPSNFIDVFIKRFLNNVFEGKKVYAGVSMCNTSFGKKSLQLRSKLVKSMQNSLSSIKLS